jgi:hypothetical protein
MFKQITSMKELITIKHKYLLVIMKKDSPYYKDKCHINNRKSIYYKPEVDKLSVRYKVKMEGNNKPQFSTNEDFFTFDCPNFDTFDFYICDDKEELKIGEALAQIK